MARSLCDGYHKKALLPPGRALPRYPPLGHAGVARRATAIGASVLRSAVCSPRARGLPAFCRIGADAFGPHIEMAAQTERSRGAKKILVLTANGFLLWGLSWSEAGVAPADRRGQIGDF